MLDRLVVWLLLAAAFVAAVIVLVVGLQPMAVVGLLHVPAVLLTLLVMRAIVCLILGRQSALRVGSRQILPGAWSLVVPLLLLSAWTFAREAGVVSARVCRTTHQDRTNTSWMTINSHPITGVAPTSPLAIVGGSGALHDRFASDLRDIGQVIPGQQMFGHIELQAAPPMALLPLWKSVSASGRVVVDLTLRENDAPRQSRLSGTIHIDSDSLMLGFASQRDCHDYLGSNFAAETRKHLVEQLQKMAATPR